MSSSKVQLSAMAPWRRAANIVLLVVAVAILVLAVTNVIQTAALIGGAAVVALAYAVGPRSPFFHADPV